ncbi:hypothetical protein FRZ67_00380 [Panacibacter ginsenosidivorans]|uniref:Uncharacterized protein n=1 Tax=Panacibacter ginsenosidivorans TaxID=1813871 RepID=A0A5B8V536_9BACT|nr:hypothetical protein [Panacibacter ginsenosidivorans]QEC65831.1 hypothetical protein FRZ67_00380 [Panacibacter ginsenosidivorans]
MSWSNPAGILFIIQLMRYLLLLILLTQFYACNSGSETYLLRDSVTHKYLSIIDTSGQYDTSEINYKILRAYISNDTTFFHQLQQDIDKNSSRERANWDLWDSDIPLPKLQNLNVDEAYRFIFSIVASPSYDVVTITKQQDMIMLYYTHFNRDDINYTPPKVAKSDSTILQINQWDELTSKLYNADFWGLKKENNRRGTDGSDLTVIGYRKGINGLPEKYNYVHRFWSSTLDNAFFYVYFKLLDKKYKP